jgi:uncharacterized protein (DUF2267 family)
MDAQQFTAVVQEAAGVDEAHAVRAITATLGTLAERLAAGEARDLAAALPPELAPALATTGPAEGFDVDEFVRRVAEREGVDLATAERDARAAFTALGRAVSADELADVAAELPRSFATLLPTGRDIEVMSAQEFLARVARRAGLDAEGAARATEVVLETLAERIAGGEVDDLADRLPLALHPPLRRGNAVSGGEARSMPLARFLGRVAEREGVPPPDALVHARAVLVTLREAVGDDEFFDVTVQLPADYARALMPARPRVGR